LRHYVIALAIALFFTSGSQLGAAALVRPALEPSYIRPEGAVTSGPASGGSHPLMTETSTATRQAMGKAALGEASLAASSTSIEFLTRPYTTWHNITSVFDHCNPDYSVDGKVCEFDGSIGLKGYGSDPGFSLGYAQTPGGGDYLYYDGHNGWDYALAYENVRASADGTVALAGSDSYNPCFGQTIVINHPNGFSTRYAHLSSIYVSAGQNVSRGQVIAVSGNTGCSSGPHLHFGVYVTSSWTAIDPWGWSGAGSDPWGADQGNLWLTGYAQFPLPWVPLNVSAVPASGSALVSWQPPQFDGGLPIASYTVTSSAGQTATVSGNNTSATVSGLSNGSSYTFTVTALNSVGASAASTASAAVVPTDVPGPPTGVHAAPSAGAAVLSWSPPQNAGGSPITAYKVTGPNGISLSTGPDTSATVSGLINGQTYSFTVTGENAVGAGIPSAPSNNVTPLSRSPWESLGGVLNSGAEATSWGPNRLDVFAVGTDGAAYQKSWDGSRWSGWASLGGKLSSDPAAVSVAANRIDLFARGTDDALWQRSFDGTRWGAWQSLGGVLASGPAAAAMGSGQIDVFALGSDSSLYHRHFDGSAWAGWEGLGGKLTSDPSATSPTAGRLDVFGRGTDQAVYHKSFSAGSWSGWESLGGYVTSGPEATSWGTSRIDLVARGTDNSLQHAWFDGSGWNGWESAGGNLTADPSIVSWGPGRLDVFGRGTNRQLYHFAYD
jgi:murein DD-endopeptidase MepM/ murein hydrolase activator NlpD